MRRLQAFSEPRSRYAALLTLRGVGGTGSGAMSEDIGDRGRKTRSGEFPELAGSQHASAGRLPIGRRIPSCPTTRVSHGLLRAERPSRQARKTRSGEFPELAGESDCSTTRVSHGLLRAERHHERGETQGAASSCSWQAEGLAPQHEFLAGFRRRKSHQDWGANKERRAPGVGRRKRLPHCVGRNRRISFRGPRGGAIRDLRSPPPRLAWLSAPRWSDGSTQHRGMVLPPRRSPSRCRGRRGPTDRAPSARR